LSTQPHQPETPPPVDDASEEDLGKPQPALVIFLLIPLLGILAALGMVVVDLQSRDAQAPLPTFTAPDLNGAQELINYAAPDFTLPMLDGETQISLDDYAGRILFINFWQTTCVPCITEMPEFMDFFGDQDPDEVALLAINVDETPEMVEAFFEEYDIAGIPVAMDRDSTVRRDYGVMGFPMTFVITSEGVVRFMNIGTLEYDDLEEYVELLQDEQVSS
jgi:peroxiredoxin